MNEALLKSTTDCVENSIKEIRFALRLMSIKNNEGEKQEEIKNAENHIIPFGRFKGLPIKEINKSFLKYYLSRKEEFKGLHSETYMYLELYLSYLNNSRRRRTNNS